MALLRAVARDTSAVAWAQVGAGNGLRAPGERDELLRIMTPELRAAAKWDEVFALVGRRLLRAGE